MLSLKKKLLLFTLLFNLSISHGQVVFEPTYHSVYSYLSRLAQKGVIDLNDVVLPLSKDYIYTKLDEVSKKIAEITPLEREELAFYLKEYTLWWRNDPKSGFEGEYRSILKAKVGDRFRTFAIQDPNFALNVQPILGLQTESRNGYSYVRNWKGFWAYGYLGKHIGYSVDFRATSETGKIDDYLRDFSPETGVIGTKTDYKTFNFNETNVSITGSWEWGKFTIGKNYMPVGYGQGGKIILSDKAPSFPQIRLDVNPKEWLSFNYAHIWLNSLVVDSTSLQSVPGTNRLEYQFKSKFLATHSLTLRPIKNLRFTVGESAVYSDKLRFEYMIPIALFSGMSHYMGELVNNSISNSSIFTQLSIRNIPRKTHIYASFFIDELRLNSIDGDSTNSRNQTAYQLGMSVADFPIRNMSIVAEYSRIRPFAYIHFIPEQSYQNSGYNLGHWIGSNADQFFAQMKYRIKRGMEVNIVYQYIRKGSVGVASQQIADNKYLFPFLWGEVKNHEYFSTTFQYELVHDLFLKLGYNHSNQANQNNSNKLMNDQFIFGVNFGF